MVILECAGVFSSCRTIRAQLATTDKLGRQQIRKVRDQHSRLLLRNTALCDEGIRVSPQGEKEIVLV